MNKLSSVVLAGVFATLVPVAVLAYDGKAIAPAAAEKPKNILDAARDNGGFSVFLAAVEHADMTAALSSPRMQYTLYAPTDAAFAKIPKEQLVALLEDKDELRRVIAQHVAVGRYQSSDIGPGIKRTLWGEPLAVTTHRNLHVNWVKVVATDLDSGNGIVHATDNVIFSSGDSDSAFSQQLAQFNAASLGQGNRF
jgi:uncharacterized surface protein with fasciclin (FAS1) repeats